MRFLSQGAKDRLKILCAEYGIAANIKSVEDDGSIITGDVQSKGIFGFGETYRRVDFLSAIMTIANGVKGSAGNDDLGKFKIAGCDDILNKLGSVNPEQAVGNLMALASIGSIPTTKQQNQGPSPEELKKRDEEKAKKQKEIEEAKAAKEKEKKEAEEKRKREQEERQRQNGNGKPKADEVLLPWSVVSYDEENETKTITKTMLPESKIAEKVIDHIKSGGQIELLS